MKESASSGGPELPIVNAAEEQMKVIRERNEEISGTNFWRQEGEDASLSQIIQEKQLLHFTGQPQGFGGSDKAPANLLPVDPSSRKCKNTSLDAVFSVFWSENKMLCLLLPRHPSSLDCVLSPIHRKILHSESCWEWCPGILPELTYLLILEVASTSFGAFVFAPLGGCSSTSML